MGKKKASQIGKKVTYQPNGQDLGTRPKNTALPAIIVDESEQHKSGCGKNGNETVNREVATLVVFVATEPGTVLKKNIPHKAIAEEGEAYWE